MTEGDRLLDEAEPTPDEEVVGEAVTMTPELLFVDADWLPPPMPAEP
jgi:hypothetical protein